MNKEEKLYMKYCKYDKEPKEVILELIHTIEKQNEIIKQQSYTNQKLRKKKVELNQKLRGYRKLVKLKDKHLETQSKQIDLMAEDLTTDYHSKEWVMDYYEKKAREYRVETEEKK